MQISKEKTRLTKRCVNQKGEPSALWGGDARKIIETKQALGKAYNSVTPSRSTTTPYASKSKVTRWYEEQEESSHPSYSELRRECYLTSKLDKRPRKDVETNGHFCTNPRNILMEIKGNPILRQPKPIETPTKVRNKNKYREYHEDFGHTTSEHCELRRAIHELADQGQVNNFLRRSKGEDRNRRNPKGQKGQ
ncbi:hypothetical protein Cgig2_028748 [Carnegiea gigantea]|uniref:Reverse transcriptase domain-containing protein n=1 Tax=Carnegiea gigantea TaxID=171969 RepID=A0A9Q1GXZ5_9CARY|nr:hypothetical protein Cgig2_028748 [Carnegiea gigantea]